MTSIQPVGRVLIVDDDDLFVKNYKAILSAEGYHLGVATSPDQALTRLDSDAWDVVLLDQWLGPTQGVELISEIKQRVPGSKIIVVTAYAREDTVERAFALGVYDFLEKSEMFRVMLEAKLRNAVEAVRTRMLSELQPDENEARIRSLWATLSAERDNNRKGLVLEELMLLVFRSINGFHVSDVRRRSQDEEIDLVIRNESSDPLWAKESTYILVECKNWSRPVGRKEFDAFLLKLQRRYGRVTLGFFVAPGGVTAGFLSIRQTERKSPEFVVCIDSDGLRQLVESEDRNQTLKELHDQAVVDAGGGAS